MTARNHYFGEDMKTNHTLIAVLLLAFSTGACATESLTGKGGMSLYTFDADSDGKSACSGGCLSVWPAARPGDAKGSEFGEITRQDGTKQLTFQGKPVYYYVNDRKPGDQNGDKLQNVWHVLGGAKGYGGPAPYLGQ